MPFPITSALHRCHFLVSLTPAPTNIHSSGVSQPHHFGLRWGNETRQLKVLFSEACLKHEAITSGDDCKLQNTQTQDSFFATYTFLSYPRSPELQPHKIIDSCPCWFISSNTLQCRKMKGHPTVWSRSHLHLYYSTGWVNADSVCQSESVSWCGWTLHRLSNTPKLVVTQDKENVCKNLPDGGFICLFLKIKSKTGRGKKINQQGKANKRNIGSVK